jgi:hypothetical protein
MLPRPNILGQLEGLSVPRAFKWRSNRSSLHQSTAFGFSVRGRATFVPAEWGSRNEFTPMPSSGSSVFQRLGLSMQRGRRYGLPRWQQHAIHTTLRNTPYKFTQGTPTFSRRSIYIEAVRHWLTLVDDSPQQVKYTRCFYRCSAYSITGSRSGKTVSWAGVKREPDNFRCTQRLLVLVPSTLSSPQIYPFRPEFTTVKILKVMSLERCSIGTQQRILSEVSGISR